MNLRKGAEKLFKKSPFFFLLTSGILLAVAFPPSKLFLLSFFTLIPLFYFLDEAKTKKQAFWGSWLFGAVYYGWITRWFFSALPLDWTGVYNEALGGLGMLFIWLLTASAMGLAVAGFGWIYKCLPQKNKVFLIPAAWVVFEYLSSFAFGIIWAGGASAIGPYWSFGALGYVFSSIPSALFFAKTLGLYGASFVVAYVNAGIFSTLKSQNKRREMLRFLIPLFVGLSILFSVQKMVFQPRFQETERKLVSLVQTQSAYPDAFLGGFFSKVVGQSMTLLEKVNTKSKVVVLPEGGFFKQRIFEEQKGEMRDLFEGNDTVIISNTKSEEGVPGPVEIIKYYPDSEKEESLGQKTLLVPFGEYLPYIFRFPLMGLGGENWVLNYAFDHPFTKGGNFYFGNSKEAVVLCSSVFAPTLWEDAARRGAEIFILPASQWFFKGSSFYGQVRASLRFFAAENDKWMLEAANGGYSYIIDESGDIQAQSKTPTKMEIIEGEAAYRQGITFAANFKNWAVYVSFAGILICFSGQWLRQKRKKQ